MAKFIKVKDFRGGEYMVNVDNVIYMLSDISHVTEKPQYHIYVPGASIWLDVEEYERVKSILEIL